MSRTDADRAGLTIAAGWAIIVLSAGSALLPAAGHIRGPSIIGWLLLTAGAIEVFAGVNRRSARIPAIAAGLLTVAAGVILLVGGARGLLPTITLVTGWLLLRSIVLLAATVLVRTSSVRRWTGIAAGTDFLLGALLLLGVSIASLVYNLFGPTEGLVASFAWVFALSFVATGTMLLEVGNCERAGAA